MDGPVEHALGSNVASFYVTGGTIYGHANRGISVRAGAKVKSVQYDIPGNGIGLNEQYHA
jgi:hypothetical protein